MAAPKLPAAPPTANRLSTLLATERGYALVGNGRASIPLKTIVTTAMTSRTTERMAFKNTARAQNITAWITTHHLRLLHIVGTEAERGDDELVIRLVTDLLLLTPPGMDAGWTADLAAAGTRAADRARRLQEYAVLCELAARCDIAEDRLPNADALHDNEQQALLRLTPPQRWRPLVLALAWRRVRTHWQAPDTDGALNHLYAIAGLLDLVPSPHERLLREIAQGEVLYSQGRYRDAVLTLTNATGTHIDRRSILTRVDAETLAGHALHHSQGPPAARRQWAKTLGVVNGQFGHTSRADLDPDTTNELTHRRQHLLHLLSGSGLHTPRPDYTVLGPQPTTATTTTPPKYTAPGGTP